MNVVRQQEIVTTEPTTDQIEEMIERLKADPKDVKVLFPGLSGPQARTLVPEPERPLVTIPRADGWADS